MIQGNLLLMEGIQDPVSFLMPNIHLLLVASYNIVEMKQQMQLLRFILIFKKSPVILSAKMLRESIFTGLKIVIL